jgi:NhaA family Na+:H+ antiporter
MLLGLGLWAATLYSGIHATIAGVLLALTIPATRQIEEQPYVGYMKQMLADFEREAKIVPDRITDTQSHALSAMQFASQAVQTPLARVEHALLKPVNFLIMPLFALANAGIVLGAVGLNHPVAWGVILGLIVGKPAGILLASWLAVKSGAADLPSMANWRQMLGISVLCGLGFTMSLFIANLAFTDTGDLLGPAKAGILAASLVSGVIGGAIIAASRSRA